MQLQTPKVSVIFPIYNNESYLERCIRSVMNQTMQEIEMILINDGSTDASPAIIDQLAQEDNRIQVVHKENEGYSATVNRGLDMARGEYVAIVESDDFVAPEMYEKLCERAKRTNADIVKCGFMYHYDKAENEEDENREFMRFYFIAEEYEVFEAKEYPRIFQLHASVWAGLYRRGFLNKRKLRFLETPGATYSDYSWMVMTYAYAKRMTILHLPLYYYTFDNVESSHFMYGERYQYKMYHAMESHRILREAGIFDEVKEDIAVQSFSTCIDTVYHITLAQRQDCFDRIRQMCIDLFDDDFNYLNFGNRYRTLIELIQRGECEKFYELCLFDHMIYDAEDLLDKRVALFGAGRCGRGVCIQLNKMKIEIVKWVDNEPKEWLGVEYPDILTLVEFDVVLIALIDRKNVDEIRQQLIKLDIPEEKIVWKLPVRLV